MVILRLINTARCPTDINATSAQSCKQTFSERFDKLYYWRRVSPEQVQQVLQAHSEGSNLGGIVVGLPLKVTSNDVDSREDEDTSLHLEAFYRYQVTNNIGITPGILVMINPEHNKDNDTIYVGTVRTTFSF